MENQSSLTKNRQNKEDITYNVQCLAGHVYEVSHGSDIEKRCIEREKQGYLGAMCLSSEECSYCHEYRQERLQREACPCDNIGFFKDEDDI